MQSSTNYDAQYEHIYILRLAFLYCFVLGVTIPIVQDNYIFIQNLYTELLCDLVPNCFRIHRAKINNYRSIFMPFCKALLKKGIFYQQKNGSFFITECV